jgi:hypothetical protein
MGGRTDADADVEYDRKYKRDLTHPVSSFSKSGGGVERTSMMTFVNALTICTFRVSVAPYVQEEGWTYHQPYEREHQCQPRRHKKQVNGMA